MTNKYVVKEFRKTSIACPAVWEGTVDDEDLLYIRCRHGRLRVDVNLNTVLAVSSDDVEDRDFDGSMDTDTMIELTSSVLDWLHAVEGDSVADDPSYDGRYED